MELKSKSCRVRLAINLYKYTGKQVKTMVRNKRPKAMPKDSIMVFKALINFFCFKSSSSLDNTASDKANVDSKATKMCFRK